MVTLQINTCIILIFSLCCFMLKIIKDEGQIPEMLHSFWMAFLNVAIICCSLRCQLVSGQFLSIFSIPLI